MSVSSVHQEVTDTSEDGGRDVEVQGERRSGTLVRAVGVGTDGERAVWPLGSPDGPWAALMAPGQP